MILLAARPPTVVDLTQEWWEVALQVLIALGTLAAVAAALWVADRDRRAADARAEEDRNEAARRQREERHDERREADLRWQLDLLLRISTAWESFAAKSSGSIGLPVEESKATVLAAVRVHPADFPFLHGWLTYSTVTTPDDVAHWAGVYGVRAGADVQAVGRAEILHVIEQTRRDLSL